MTTPVGSIRLDLTINGQGALAGLAQQVRSTFQSVQGSSNGASNSLQRMTREVRAVRQEVTQTTAPTAALARAVGELADNYQRAAAAAAAYRGASPSVSDLGAQTIAVNQLADAYARLATTQTAAAAAPNPSSAGGGGGGSGGGGRRGGVAGFLTGGVGLNAIALGASALPAATLGVTNLLGAIQQLGQGLIVMPGLMAGAITSVGALALGMKGLGESIGTAREAIVAGDFEALNGVMKELHPSAQQLVGVIAGPLADAGKTLQQTFQANALQGVGNQLQSLAVRYMPAASGAATKLGQAWNGTFQQLIKTADSESTRGLFDRIIGNTAEGQNRANAAIEPLVKGIGTLAAAGTDAIPRLADALGAVATRFSNFITAADQDGRLAKWIDDGLTGMTDFGNTILNLGKSLTYLTQAAGGDGGLLKLMAEGSRRLAEFMGSAEGQEKLTRFFDEARATLSDWLPILGNVANIIGDVYQGFKQWGDTILPIVKGITDVLADMPGLVQAAVTGFIAFKTISGITGLLTSLTGVSTALRALPGQAGTAAAGIGSRFGSVRTQLGLGLLTGGVITGMGEGGPGWGGAAATIGGGALAGAGIAGLPGAAIGAVVGGVVTGFQALQADLTNTRNALGNFADKLREEAANNPRFSGAATGVDVVPQFAPVPGNQIDAFTPKPDVLPSVGGIPINPLYGGPPAVVGRNADKYLPPVQNAGGMPGPSVDAIVGTAERAEAALNRVREATAGLSNTKGEVVIENPSPEILADIEALQLKVTNLEPGKLAINVQYMLDGRPISRSQLITPIQVGAFPGDTTPGRLGGRAGGGVLPGYSPGVDNLLVPMSGGEGVIIPEAMRALGSRWLYNLNSRYRPGLSKQGYDDGGVVAGGGLFGDLFGTNTIVTLLTEIRDALTGGKLTLPDAVDKLDETLTVGGGAKPGTVAGASRGIIGMDGKTAADGVAHLGTGALPGPSPMPIPAGAEGLIAFAQAASGGQYKWGASDLAAGLSDCSGAISDLVEIITKGQADSGRLFNAGPGTRDALTRLGAVEGAIPGALQIGWDNTHMRSTLPNGVAFESGGQTGQGATYGGNARGAAGMENIMSIPVGPLAGMLGDQMGGMASDMCGCVSDAMPDMAKQGLNALVGGLTAGGQEVAGNLINAGTRGVMALGDRPDGPLVKDGGDNATTALANLLGMPVQDFTRAGGGAAAQNLLRNMGPAYGADGRMVTDTAVLIDRTFTSMETANEARHRQQMQLLTQVKDLLTEKLLKPTMEAAVTGGINGMSSAVTAQIGSGMGTAAAGPIASAVKSAIPVSTGRASGGVLPGYSPGVDNLLVPMSGGEGVLIPEAVRGLGGAAAIYAINSRYRAGLSKAGYAGMRARGYAAGGLIPGGANATVGADFFGVSQVPILADIVNMLVQLLLAVIGVQISVRDTLSDMTDEIRGFRGDFTAFDATGRLASDTAGLTARTQTGRQIAEQQRMRILKDVIIGALRFVIEDILMPMLKAAIQAAINFGTQAISGAVGAAASTFAPGSGGIASGLTNAAVGALGSIAQAGADVFLNILSTVLTQGAGILVEQLGSALTGLMPNLLGSISGFLSGLGGGLTGGLQMLLGPFISLGRMIGGAFGGLFDEGGDWPTGTFGLNMSGHTERVLSPGETRSLDRLEQLLASGSLGGDNSRTEVNTPIYVTGDRAAGEAVRDIVRELVAT